VVTGRRYHIVETATPDTSLGWTTADSGLSAAERLAAEPTPDTPFHPGAPKLHAD